MGAKLSQIIFYVDGSEPLEDFCAICTKALENRDDIWFTYICYDNQNDNVLVDKSDELYESMGHIRGQHRTKITNKSDFEVLVNNNKDKYAAGTNELLIVSDNEDLIEIASLYGIPRIAVLNENNNGATFKGAGYCITDIAEIQYYHLERIWQRYNNIPWIIAETDRIIIREQVLDDLDELIGIYNDPETVRYMDGLYSDRDKEADYMKEYINKQYRFYEYGIWSLVDKNSGRLIGRAGIDNRAGYEDVEIGYVIGRKYRNKGYAYEAVSKIIEYAAEELNISCLNAFTREENLASIGLLKKLHFTYIENCIIDGKSYQRYAIGR